MTIPELLTTYRTIAVVGLSDDPSRPSHSVSRYMQANGYTIIPVNPQIREALGEPSYASLDALPEAPEIVNVFRRSEYVPEIVDSAIRKGARVVWLQEGVVHEGAAEKARQAGLVVVMDRCILKEHMRL